MKPGSPLEGQLVEKYVPLVRNVVGRLAMTLPPHVDGEDLYSAGLTGLLNAVRQYNPNAGTSFETYARLRIRGAVFDELRRMDWVPRSVHTKARKVQAVMNEIEQKKGRMATEQEMAAGLKISLEDYHQWIEEIRPPPLFAWMRPSTTNSRIASRNTKAWLTNGKRTRWTAPSGEKWPGSSPIVCRNCLRCNARCWLFITLKTCAYGKSRKRLD
jgi:RNA polymerase sigma factor (sigma-70 family)